MTANTAENTTQQQYKNISVHHFGDHISIYAQEPSGAVKVFYRPKHTAGNPQQKQS